MVQLAIGWKHPVSEIIPYHATRESHLDVARTEAMGLQQFEDRCALFRLVDKIAKSLITRSSDPLETIKE